MKALTLSLIVMATVATASAVPVAQFRINIDEGVITLSDANGERVIGKTTFERWGVVVPTADKLRHVALDVTAAVIAGHGHRERSVTPDAPVYTLAEKDKAPHVTATFEQGATFVIVSDTHVHGHYEALIYMAKVRQMSSSPVVDQ